MRNVVVFIKGFQTQTH